MKSPKNKGQYNLHMPYIDICSPNVDSYSGVFHDETFTTGDHQFRIIAYRAYNAMGLYGSEVNGIALLSVTDSRVILDHHNKKLSGYSMHAPSFHAECQRIASMDPSELRDFIAKNDRSRYIPSI